MSQPPTTTPITITKVPTSTNCQAAGCQSLPMSNAQFCYVHWQLLPWGLRMDVAWTTKARPEEANQENYALEHKAALSAAKGHIAREEKQNKK